MKNILFSFFAVIMTFSASAATPVLTGLTETSFFTGSTYLGDGTNWDTYIAIDGTKFASAQVGEYIEIKGTADADVTAEKPAKFWIQDTNNSWTTLMTPDGDYIEFGAGPNFYVQINAGMLSAIKAGGCIIKGEKLTVTGISLWTATAVTDPTATMDKEIVWSGSHVFDGSYSSEVDVTPDKYADLATDNYLLFRFTGANSAQIQLNYQSTQVYNVSGDFFILKVTPEIVTLLKSKMAIKGKNLTLTSVELYVPKGTGTGSGIDGLYPVDLYTGPSKTSAGWCSDADMIVVPNGLFEDAVIGDKIVLNFSSLQTNPQISLAYKDAAWNWTEFLPAADVSGNNYIYTIKDQTVLDGLKNGHGLFVKYAAMTLDNIKLYTSVAPVTYNQASLWEGLQNTGAGWGADETIIKIEPSKFADMVIGNKIAIYFTAAATTQDYSQYQLAGWSPALWDQFVDYVTVTPPMYTWTPDEATIAKLKTEGLAIKGNNTVTTKVELLVPTTTGVKNPTVNASIDFNAPYEIYTVNGQRVNYMKNQQIYILRQNGNIVKYIKTSKSL